MGIDPTDTRPDDKYELLIPMASAALRSYTERDFGAPQVTEAREFDYDGSGYIDIDDASVLTAVAFKVPYGSPNIELTTDDWRAGPSRRDDSPVFYWVEVPGWQGALGSPEMGFTRNLDVYTREGRLGLVSRGALVTGTWGWPIVPDDVKLATFWTIQDWVTKPSGDNLTSEAIAGYARSWRQTGGAPSLAIPNKARDLLANYQKTLV